MALYKNRYLIVLYDNNDNVKQIYDNMSELVKDKKYREQKNLYFIDCLEKHNDIFVEEDEIFINEFLKETKTDKDKAKELGISLITYYRRKSKLKGVNNANEL